MAVKKAEENAGISNERSKALSLAIEKIEKDLTKYYNEGGTEKEPEPLPPAGAEKERI